MTEYQRLFSMKKIIKEIVKWSFDFIMSHYLIGSIILWISTFSFWGMLISKINGISLIDLSLDRTFYGLAFMFAVTFLISIRLYINGLILSREYLDLKEIAENIGVKGFYPHKTPENKKQDWDALEYGLKSDSVKNLYILGLTGWNTFGSPKSTLYSVISKFTGRVNVLLLNPKSEAFKNRMGELKANENIHKSELLDTLKSCQVLKKSGVNINVTFYSQRPIWKMIFTDSYMWLQHYSKNNHVDDNPVYSFYKNESGTSIFCPLTEVFEKRLHDEGSETVNLESNNFESLF